MIIFKANEGQKPANQKTPGKKPEQPKKKPKTKTQTQTENNFNCPLPKQLFINR